jgi:hypothetical protein
MAANTTRDFLRPFIIREASVDELCRVIAALSEDVRSQMQGTMYAWLLVPSRQRVGWR